MSVRAGRLSIGETGRLNYAWYANGLRWADDVEHPAAYETAVHPAPKLMTTPLILAFASPIRGTYPLWYDPSYWYSGLKVRFDWRKQITALHETLFTYKVLLLQSSPFLFGAVGMCLFAVYEKARLPALRGLRWQIAWPLAAFSTFALVHVESRFVGAFFVLFWLAVYGAPMFRVNRRVAATISAAVLCAVMIPFTVELADGAGATGPPEYQIAALGLRDLGLRKGDRLAIVGYAYDCYYARYDGLRIAAQIPNATQFWRLSAPELELAGERLASMGVRAVVASNRPDTSQLANWKDVKISPSSRLSVLLLTPEVSGVGR